MSGWNGVYTQNGLALLAKLSSGGELNITRAVVGTNIVNKSLLNQQTQINNIKQELKFQTPSYPENNVCKLPVVLSNQGLSTGYTAYQIGFYATDPDAGEILYFIAQSDTGTIILSENELKGYTATWVFYFNYGQADSVNVTVDPANAVTPDMLEEVKIIAERGVSKVRSGKYVALQNTAELPFVDLKLYGKTTQDGTPTPFSPVRVNCVGAGTDAITFNVKGNQLFDASKLPTTVTQGVVTFRNNNDGSFTIGGAGSDIAGDKFSVAHRYTAEETNRLLHAGTLTLKCNISTVPCIYVQLYDGETRLANLSNQNGTLIRSCEVTQEMLDKGTLELQISAYCAKDAVLAGGTLKPMLYQDGNGEWEPFRSIQTGLVGSHRLCGIPVTKGGNYTDSNGQQWICDEYDVLRGKIIKRTGDYRFDGSDDEDWYYVDTYGGAYISEVKRGSEQYNTPMYCNISERISWGTKVQDKYYCFVNEYDNFTIGGAEITTAYPTLNDFKTYLQNNNITLVYRLEQPYEVDVSGEMYQLNISANNPSTVVTNDAGAEMSVECIRDVHETAFKRVFEQISETRDDLQKKIKTLTDYANTDPENGVYVVTVQDLTEYHFLDKVKSLRISYPDDEHFECKLYFTAGAYDPRTVIFPTGTKYKGTLPSSLDYDIPYEITIKDRIVEMHQIYTMQTTTIQGTGA